MVIAYARTMNRAVFSPATGKNLSNIGPKLSWARLASRTRLATSADARPTADSLARCAAMPQNPTPKIAVPADDSISASALPSNALRRNSARCRRGFNGSTESTCTFWSPPPPPSSQRCRTEDVGSPYDVDEVESHWVRPLARPGRASDPDTRTRRPRVLDRPASDPTRSRAAKKLPRKLTE